MFYHDDGITQSLQFLEDMNESVGIARVQSDTGLVKDIKGTNKAASEGCAEVDTLTLTTRK
jgi:hypothetical protein